MFSNYQLSRIPANRQLQAWNAADELIVSRLATPLAEPVLIVNDSFGALAVCLNRPSLWWSDSATSQEALQANLLANEHDSPTLCSPPFSNTTFKTAIIHIPKSIRFFRWQLEQILSASASDITILAAGMVKHISAGHIKVMRELFHEANPGKAEKKARVIILTQPKKSIIPLPRTQYSVPELNLTLSNEPGCFAETRIDPGARLFISHFNQLPDAKRVLDLGCGNGVLSLALLQHQPSAELHLADDSRQAINSAKLNLANHPNCSFWHSNAFQSIPDSFEFDLILCNPPFHQSTTLTEGIATEMIKEAAKHLTATGELWLVANRHLDYRPTIKQNFSSMKLRSKNDKFNVIQCIK